MKFPPGPFFNLRCLDEMTWWQKLIWRIFGTKRVSSDYGYQVTAYYFKGVTFIYKVEEIRE